MSYVERYRAGEREAVWRELVALGEEVPSPEVLEDARQMVDPTFEPDARSCDYFGGMTTAT